MTEHDWMAEAIVTLVDASNQWQIGEMEERVRKALRILVDQRKQTPCQHVDWRGHCYLCGKNLNEIACGEQHGGWICTELSGHDGEHRAGACGVSVFHRWERPEDPLECPQLGCIRAAGHDESHRTLMLSREEAE